VGDSEIHRIGTVVDRGDEHFSCPYGE
jgi:hypothetical protein